MNISFPCEHKSVTGSGDGYAFKSQEGSYFLLGATPHSRYHGVHFFDADTMCMHKALHDVTLKSPLHSIEVFPAGVRKAFQHASQNLWWQSGIMCSHTQGKGTISIVADVRKAYDTRTDGRQHSTALRGDNPYILEFSARGTTFVLVSSAPIKVQDNWVESPTPFDGARNDGDSWWVYECATIEITGDQWFLIAPADREKEALALIHLRPHMQRHPWSGAVSQEVCQQALSGLVISSKGKQGILAGLPWFFQNWTRDAAVSVGGLLANKQFSLAARILWSLSTTPMIDGRLPNRSPSSDLGSADGTGWVAQRLLLLYEKNPEALTSAQWSTIRTIFNEALASLPRDGVFVQSGPKETWMDTTGRFPDVRSGVRVEIQALTLCMLRLFSRLSSHENMSNPHALWERSLLDACTELITHGTLRDGRDDDTLRPNIFLAAYLAPWMMSKSVWKKTFDVHLDALWLPWGGIATINPDHPWFQSFHTGSSDDSYHRGDSWYWVSNIVAIVLDTFGYKKIVDQLVLAQERDMFFLGAAGAPSEISSASEQEALGCWSQAWSASTMLELLIQRSSSQRQDL